MNIRNSKRLRIAVYIQAALQVMLPLQASWANSPVSLPRPTVINLELTSVDSARKEADLISRNYFKRGYTLASGDTLKNVAKTARVSLLTLREINRIHIPADKKFYALKAGDYLMIPDWDRPLDENAAPAVLPAASTQAAPPAQNENNSTDQRTASALNGLGSALQSKDQSSAARALAVGTATGAAAQSVQEWMNQFGNARVNLSVDDHLRYSGASADVLLPLTDKEAKNLAFTQLGVTDKDHYTTVNLGVGQRHFTDDAMLGYNLFIDQELRNQHTRLGVGAEYWRDFMKFAGNIYTGITSWKESKQLEDYEERPATGFDLRAEAWLPSMPQVGGKLKLEQYFGDEVGLISASDRQKDPLAITMGVNYTPVSLFTAGIDQRFSNGKSDTQFNLQFNYEIGTPLSQQLDPEYVKERRTLAGSRLDFVDRNNAMVMEYRKMEVIKLSLPPVLAGKTAQSHSITGTVKARHGLKHIDWDTSALQAAGARVTASKNNVLTMTLPTSPGTYPLTAIAWDKKGNASNTASMTVEVSPDSTQPGHQISHLQAQPLQQKANGVDVITYTLRATAPDGTAAKNTRVLWSTDKGVIQQPETRTNDAGESTTTLFSTDHGKVNLNAVLLDEQGNKLIDRVHKDAEFIIAKNVLTLTADKPSAKADGNDAITFTYTAKDDAGQPIADREIAWSNLDNLGVMTPASQNTDANGEAKATLISQTQGATRLAVALKNTDGTDGQNTESQPVNFTLNIAATLTEDKTQAISDGNDVITLSYQAKDGNGQPLANYDLQWETSPVLGDLTPQAAKTDKDGKATATLSSQRNGATVVSATLLDPQGSPLAKQSTNTLTFAQAGQLTLNADKLTAKANGTDVITFTYKALDSSGKPLTGRPVSWNNGTAIGDLIPVDNQTNAQGEAKATLKSLVKGITHVEAVLKNADGTDHARTKSQDVEFQLGNIATVTPDKNSAVADGVDAITLSYHVEDELGNPVAKADIDWSMSPQLGTLTPVATQTDDSGNASAKLVSNAVGDTTITVTLKDTGQQQASPRVTFAKSAALTLDADKLTAKANGTDVITFTYKALDSSGKPLTGRPVSWNKGTAIGDLTPVDNQTNAQGEAKATLKSLVKGITHVEAVLKNADGTEHARTQSQDVEFQLGNIATVTADKNTALADGVDTITLSYHVEDELGNPVDNADIDWSMSPQLGTLTPAATKTDGSGNASAKLVSNAVGDTTISVTLKDTGEQQNSPRVTFDQSATLTLNADKASAKADGTEAITFTYTATDKTGKPLASRQITWDNTNNLGTLTRSDTVTDSNGKATAVLVSSVEGRTSLGATLKNADGSDHKRTQSGEVEFVRGTVVSVNPDKNTASADGYETIIFSFEAKDDLGTPIANADIEWESQGSFGNLQPDSLKTDSSGKATAKLTSNQTGNTRVTVTLIDKDIPATSTQVTFDKSALIVLDADKSSAQADGSDTITFTYKVTDRVGTPLSGRDVVWSNTTAIGNMVPVSSRTNAQGEASATLTSTQAGQTALSVLLKNADGSNYDTKTSSQVSFATVAPFVVALSSDHNQSWATNSHKRTLSMLVTQAGQPVSGKDLAWDMSSCASCNVDNVNPVSDAQGKASAQFSSTAAGQQTIKICLKDDPTVCGNVNVDVLEIPTLEYRTKGSTGWNSGNWSGKPLLKEGEIELKVNNASGNITWTPSSGITLNNATSTPTATLATPATTMKIDYELFSAEPKMKLSQQFALNGTPVLRPGAPQLLNYQDAINACQAIGASQVDESIAGAVYSTWGNIANIGNYGAVFSPWLNGTLGSVPGMQDNAKAMDLRNGSVLTLFNAYSSNTHVLCAQ